jgi:hypothetical protein
VQAGDIVVADRDGIVLIRPEELALVVKLCRELAEHESLIGEAIAQGVDLKDLDFNSTTHAPKTLLSPPAPKTTTDHGLEVRRYRSETARKSGTFTALSGRTSLSSTASSAERQRAPICSRASQVPLPR